MISSNIDYFIICHNKSLIPDTVHNLPNYKILLVGNQNNNTEYQNLIQCSQLEYNIENYPLLCSFTGWYAVAKNFADSYKKVCLLEYDVQITDQFDKINQRYNNMNNSIVSYDKTLLHHYVFYKSTPWLEIALKKVYNIQLIELLNSKMKNIVYWPVSTNHMLDMSTLISFIDWFMPMAELFKNDKLGSYVHERAFFIYCVLNDIRIEFSLNNLKHYQLCSHNNDDIYGQFLKEKNTRDFTPTMIPEYDQIYNIFKDKIYDNIY
jgi:hypothetical protein